MRRTVALLPRTIPTTRRQATGLTSRAQEALPLRDSAGIPPDFAGNHDTPLSRGRQDPTRATGRQVSSVPRSLARKPPIRDRVRVRKGGRSTAAGDPDCAAVACRFARDGEGIMFRHHRVLPPLASAVVAAAGPLAARVDAESRRSALCRAAPFRASTFRKASLSLSHDPTGRKAASGALLVPSTRTCCRRCPRRMSARASS
jgi:hypothetical protein